ncbi:MAG: hypothetical protein MJ096_02840 [Clostridia bacterium]|nr:hypothetical protein [Clostridia bacterium]
MKKIIILTLALCLVLTSCSLFRGEGDTGTTAPETKEPYVTYLVVRPADTEPETTAAAPSEPGTVGFYNDEYGTGVYERVDTYTAPWIAGTDIVVFGVIPSTAPTLETYSYKQLWQDEAVKVKEDGLVKMHFTLRYTLVSGEEVVCPIGGPADAEALNDGHLEIYLYDDVHQPDGAWYSHVTEYDLNDETVFSSIKVTAGEMIDEVTSIELDVYSGMSETEAPTTVKFVRG